MSDGYYCYHNALSQRMNRILKYDFLVLRPANLLEAQQMVSELAPFIINGARICP